MGCPQGQAQHRCSISARAVHTAFRFIGWPFSFLLYLLPLSQQRRPAHMHSPWRAVGSLAVLASSLGVGGLGGGGVWEEMAGVARGPSGPPQSQPRSVHRPSLRPAFLPNVLPSPSLSSTPLSSPPFPSSPPSLGTEVLGNCFSSLEVPFCGRQHVLGALGRWAPCPLSEAHSTPA